jgi:POT family proton-dependent oligopeptide transporter
MSDEQSDLGPVDGPKENMVVKYFKDFKVLKKTKREYWGLQVVNMLDCLAYFAMFNIATVTLTNDFGFTDVWAGYIYTIFSGLTTIFLFFSGVITDWLGIKRALYLAIVGLLLTRIGVVVVQYMDEPVRMNETTALQTLYDGEGVKFVEGAPDVRITAADGTTFEVDLFGATTMGDVVSRINDAPGNGGKIEASIAAGWTSIRLEDRMEENDKDNYKKGLAGRIVVESAHEDSEAVDKLAIGSDGEIDPILQGGRIVTDLNGLNVADLNQGDGIEDADSLFIRDRWGAECTVTGLGSCTTLKQIIDRINTVTAENDVHIAVDYNTPGTGLQFIDRNGRNPITLETPLDVLSTGRGVPVGDDPKVKHLKFTARDGQVYEVSLAGAETIGDVIQLVTEGTGGHITLDLLGSRFFAVTDTKPDLEKEQVKLACEGIEDVGKQVARRLGLAKARGVKRYTFDGAAISNPQWRPAAVTVGDLIDRINDAGGNVNKLTATLTEDGAIVLTDNTQRDTGLIASIKNLFRGSESLCIQDEQGDTAAAVLGLVAETTTGSIIGVSLGDVTLDTPLSELNDGKGLPLNDDDYEFVINTQDDTELGVELGNRVADHILAVEGDAAVALGFEDESNDAAYPGENITENKLRSWLTILLLACMAPFMAMLITCFQAGNRRFTTSKSRGAGFNLWYLFMNVGAAGGGFLIDIIYLKMDLPQFHVFTFGIGTGILCLIATFFMIKNDDQLIDEDEEAEKAKAEAEKQEEKPDKEPEAERAEESFDEKMGLDEPELNKKKPEGPWEITKAVLSEPVFWRFTVLITLLLGVRAVFLYLGLLFPKFWYRVIGPDAQVGTLQAFNPVLVIIGLILVIPILQKFNVYKMLVFGAFITSISMLIPALPPMFGMGIVEWTYLTTIAFLLVLTVGELIWSPRLSEYTAAIAPEGQEGTYLGLSMVPYFLAKLVVSALSGNMLQRWCPDSAPGEPNVGEKIEAGELAFWDTPYVMWIILGAAALIGTIFAILGKGWFTKGAHFDNAESDE